MNFTKDIKFNNMPSSNHNVDITYNGFLSNSSELYIVYGFGENWDNTTEVKMTKNNNNFSAEINILDSDTFNFCFRNSENQWDNNSNCNYISPIIPAQKEIIEEKPVQEIKFDLNALIDELLEPIIFKKSNEIIDNTPIQIESTPINLGMEVANELSKIEYSPNTTVENLSSLDDILAGTVVNEKTIELFDEENLFEEPLKKEDFSDEKQLVENISNLFDPDKIAEETLQPIQEISNEVETEVNEEKALIAIDDPFIVSSRQLSKFYLFKKRIKLALYKALVKIPSLIFGSQEDY